MATLHPKTVSNYQQHTRKTVRTSSATGAMKSVKVDMRVWRTAMRLAKNDATRLVVQSPTEVVVTNRSRKKT